ncbi:MAG: thioredoxin domain-containing protein [Actinomycetes bacterium]
MATRKVEKASAEKGTKILVIGMVIFVVAVGVIFSIISNNQKNHVTTPSQVSKAEDYGIVFNAKATPRLDIWEDFQCPICNAFEATNNAYVNEIVKGGKTKVVFHPVSFIGTNGGQPLSSDESAHAAAVAACAADAGKFVEMHKALYMDQATTENSGKWTDGHLVLLAANVGISTPAFAQCVSSGKYLGWTQAITATMAKHKVTGTPTIFLNGKVLNYQTKTAKNYVNIFDAAAFKKALKAGGVL